MIQLIEWNDYKINIFLLLFLFWFIVLSFSGLSVSWWAIVSIMIINWHKENTVKARLMCLLSLFSLRNILELYVRLILKGMLENDLTESFSKISYSFNVWYAIFKLKGKAFILFLPSKNIITNQLAFNYDSFRYLNLSHHVILIEHKKLLMYVWNSYVSLYLRLPAFLFLIHIHFYRRR